MIMMKYLRFAFSVWVAVAVYGFASITFGRTGILAMRRLEAERDRLSANMDRLRAINGELELSVVALRSDADTISVHARELGYGRDDERFVRIVGVPAAGNRAATAGNIVAAVRPDGVSAGTLRIISALAGASAYILSSLTRFSRKDRRG
jgi:cell division protein FtsB